MNEKLDLSIVIVSWNVKDLLETCLKSIYQQTKDISFEVFVIDNQSSDGTVEMIENEIIRNREQYPNFELIANNFNAGFAQGNNQGIIKSQGKHVLLLNPDTEIIQHNTFSKCLDFYKKNEKCGVLGCKLLNTDKSQQESVRRYPKLLSSILVLLKIHNLFPKLKSIVKYYALDFDYNKTQIVDQVMGAFFMFPRNMVNKIGMMDEGYWIWFEEVDYCKQSSEIGYETYYYPEVEIVHVQGQSFNQVLSLRGQKRMNRSMRRYFRKHKNFLEYLIILPFMPISLLLSWGVQLFEKNNINIKKHKKLV